MASWSWPASDRRLQFVCVTLVLKRRTPTFAVQHVGSPRLARALASFDRANARAPRAPRTPVQSARVGRYVGRAHSLEVSRASFIASSLLLRGRYVIPLVPPYSTARWRQERRRLFGAPFGGRRVPRRLPGGPEAGVERPVRVPRLAAVRRVVVRLHRRRLDLLVLVDLREVVVRHVERVLGGGGARQRRRLLLRLRGDALAHLGQLERGGRALLRRPAGAAGRRRVRAHEHELAAALRRRRRDPNAGTAAVPAARARARVRLQPVHVAHRVREHGLHGPVRVLVQVRVVVRRVAQHQLEPVGALVDELPAPGGQALEAVAPGVALGPRRLAGLGRFAQLALHLLVQALDHPRERAAEVARVAQAPAARVRHVQSVRRARLHVLVVGVGLAVEREQGLAASRDAGGQRRHRVHGGHVAVEVVGRPGGVVGVDAGHEDGRRGRRRRLLRLAGARQGGQEVRVGGGVDVGRDGLALRPVGVVELAALAVGARQRVVDERLRGHDHLLRDALAAAGGQLGARARRPAQRQRLGQLGNAGILISRAWNARGERENAVNCTGIYCLPPNAQRSTCLTRPYFNS